MNKKDWVTVNERIVMHQRLCKQKYKEPVQ